MAPTAPMPDMTVAVMIVFYGPDGPIYVEDTATLHPDGTVDVNVPVGITPAPGTGVQVTIYLPTGPVTHEGRTTGDGSDGTIGLDLDSAPSLAPTTPMPMPSPAPALMPE